MISPCYECDNREIGCHFMCSGYNAYRVLNAGIKPKEDEYQAYQSELSVKKIKRKSKKGRVPNE